MSLVSKILYAYGMPSALSFAQRLGLDRYEPGSAGETLTLDAFDETDVSVGDIFEIGEVIAQATFPRIPCGSVSQTKPRIFTGTVKKMGIQLI